MWYRAPDGWLRKLPSREGGTGGVVMCNGGSDDRLIGRVVYAHRRELFQGWAFPREDLYCAVRSSA